MTTGKQILERKHQIRVQRKDAFKAFVALAETINDKKVSEMHPLHRYELYAHAARIIGYEKAAKTMATKAVKQAFIHAEGLVREAPNVGHRYDMQVYSDFAGVIARNGKDIATEFNVQVPTNGLHLGSKVDDINEVFYVHSADDSLFSSIANEFFYAPLVHVVLPNQYNLSTNMSLNEMKYAKFVGNQKNYISNVSKEQVKIVDVIAKDVKKRLASSDISNL